MPNRTDQPPAGASGTSAATQPRYERDYDLHHLLSFQSTKWAVFGIAALTSLSGLAILVLGIYTLSNTTSTLGDRTLPVLMLIVGALVFLISLGGVTGTVTYSRPMLYTFLVGLLVLVTSELVLGIVALANEGAVDNALDDAWQRAYDAHPRIIRDIQEQYGCCGFRYTTDRAVPKTSPDACLKSVEFGYQTSCYRSLVGGYRKAQNAVGVTCIVLAGVQLVAVFLSYMMLQHLPKTHHTGSWWHSGSGDNAAERQHLIACDAYGNPIYARIDEPVVGGRDYNYYGGTYRTGGYGPQQQQVPSVVVMPAGETGGMGGAGFGAHPGDSGVVGGGGTATSTSG
ncbi:Tetraspanin family-domain-containing protein [Catenaria anguillulae PL171]|uniref:Tetraspanin family-domain-containing protein n=1 Tax=Catenaria anguillulae PL171 TaxID=765915 RepID=A0A1Y2HQE7_9FUNG|nr:Tetraspanin family-domain-containing protein [Catenaria anguillulae PL171]